VKLLKTSIVVLFLLSLASAGLTYYLSTVRENEKEKRIYLEGVKTDLEHHVASLESEKAELEKKVTGLESEKQELTKKFEEEKEAHQKVLDQLHVKDQDLESLKGQADQAKTAFENAQKRNQELERILDELESRMRQVETQKNATGPNAGYINVSVAPASSGASSPTVPQIASTPVASAASVPQTPESVTKTQENALAPRTNLPTPPKRRKFFPFFHSSNQQKPSLQEEPLPVQSTREEKVVEAPTSALPVSAEKPQVEETVQKPVVTVTPSQTANQTIAAGNVLLVNRKYNFIVISLGSRQGLKLDDVLAVQHGSAEIAKARVEKLYDDYCAAYIVEEQSEHPIAQGDSATAT